MSACTAPTPARAPHPGQRGFSLFVVLVVLLLSALLALGGAWTAQLLESTAGNQREYQRAFDAAEAALLDAERDIRQLVFDTATQTYATCPGAAPSRCRASTGLRVFPDQADGGLTGYAPGCLQGICYFGDDAFSAAAGSKAYGFWNGDHAAKNAASYGQFTGAPDADSPAMAGARYWIEVIDRGPKEKGPIYRITALGIGARSEGAAGGTRVVLQMSFDPDAARPLN